MWKTQLPNIKAIETWAKIISAVRYGLLFAIISCYCAYEFYEISNTEAQWKYANSKNKLTKLHAIIDETNTTTTTANNNNSCNHFDSTKRTIKRQYQPGEKRDADISMIIVLLEMQERAEILLVFILITLTHTLTYQNRYRNSNTAEKNNRQRATKNVQQKRSEKKSRKQIELNIKMANSKANSTWNEDNTHTYIHTLDFGIPVMLSYSFMNAKDVLAHFI